MLLTAIRNDLARPTVHARNLFHSSLLMYDLWATFDGEADTYLLGQTLGEFECPFTAYRGERSPDTLDEALSYGVYRLLKHRFADLPDVTAGLDLFFANLRYDRAVTSRYYGQGSAAALGNYAADCVIRYGQQDGANENVFYANRFYWPVNEGLDPNVPGNESFTDPNRWQPLIFGDGFVDQSGNLFDGSRPIEFLGAEWGQVAPFALSEEDLDIVVRDGADYWLYHDPGPPPQLGSSQADTEAYLWNFFTVAAFSSQLDPDKTDLIDISPASSGNLDISKLPNTLADYKAFYKLEHVLGKGYSVNPVTGEPYEPQRVPLGDYTRVLAEFWADGPDSETPPGHWFTILNYVTDQPTFEPRFGGEGPLLDRLEWDIKAYFVLGGAMHDAAVASWGIKGAYDYPRPISVIRYMADQGQRSDPTLSNYSPHGLPLVEGLSELITADDPMASATGENVGKVKLFAWRGPDFIHDPDADTAGVGWILAEHWWPYQHPTFVTPPFAGYVSGHSTFSRAAADVLTLLTGSPYFPGGLGEFRAEKNTFLVFEEGPSVDVVLQWASYGDAADQTSLSRIWGGIHPPVDDIPGRRIGQIIAVDAFELANRYFEGRARE